MFLNRKALTKIQAVVIAIIIIVAVVGAVGYYLLTPKAPAKEYIVLGASICLSGPLGHLGETEKAGYEFAIEDINAQGGIYVKEYGRRIPVKLVVYDDESDPTKAKANAEKLLTVDRVDFLLTSWGTPMVLAAATVAEAHKVPIVGPGSASTVYEKKGFKYAFIVFHTEYKAIPNYFEMFEKVLPADKRPYKVAIWQEDTILGKDYATAVAESVKKFPGYKVVLHEVYTPRSTDYSTMILKTKEANPDIIFSVPTTTDAIVLLRQSKDLGFSPKLFNLNRACEPYEFWESLGEDAQATVAHMTGHPLLPIPKNLELTERYKKKFGTMPSTGLPAAYAAVQVLAAAIEKAGSLDKEKVREALSNISVDTVIGKVTFKGPGHAEVPIVIMQWQNGKQEIIWPEEFATAKLMYPKPAW